MRIHALAIAVAVLGTVAHAAALAQAVWPTKPVRLIVAAPPGGGTDLVGRLIAQRLGDRFGQPFVVDNRGGGGGTIAADAVAKSPPDGYTLLMANDELTVRASVATRSTYDVMKDFAPVGLVGRTAVVLGVHPRVPASTVGELVAIVRSQPGKFSFASCGTGSVLHLAGELLNLAARIDVVHLPYRGCAPAIADVVSGQVPVFFNMIGVSTPFAKSGKVKLLAVASEQRLPANPSLPTLAESGYPGFEAYPWYGVLAPAGTPREIVAKLGAEITAAVRTPEVREKLQSMYFDPTTATPEAFAEIMRADLARWGRVAREARIKVD